MLVLVPTLLLPGVGMVRPLIETCRVLTTTAPVDKNNDEQDERRSSLLCYWVVFLVGRLLLERPLDACLGGGAACQWFKVALLLWLVMPPRRFHGAGVIVRHVLQPLLSWYDAAIDEHLAVASTKARATARAAMAVRVVGAGGGGTNLLEGLGSSISTQSIPPNPHRRLDESSPAPACPPSLRDSCSPRRSSKAATAAAAAAATTS